MTGTQPEPTTPTANVAGDQGYSDDEMVTMTAANDPFAVVDEMDAHHQFTPSDNADPNALIEDELPEDVGELPEDTDFASDDNG